jgi:tetratricopeptide (TPR) repeat protein
VALTLIVAMLLGACTKSAYFEKMVPALYDVEGIDRVAVAEFDGLEQSGRIVAAEIAEGIVAMGYYKLFERSELQRILEEREFSQSEHVDPATVSELKLAGVDALIFGIVDVYSVDDQTGVTKVERKVGTGTYRVVEKEGEDGEVEEVREEIMETVLVDRGYIIREGTVGVTFRMANINTGEIVAVKTETAHFSKKKWRDEADKLPTKDEVLDGMSQTVVRRFLNQIQPTLVRKAVQFESHSDSHTEMAIKYAQAGLWEKAEREFSKAAQENPSQSAVHYNLAVTRNAIGMYQEAMTSIERAIELDPKSKYITMLAQFTTDLEEAGILERQLH